MSKILTYHLGQVNKTGEIKFMCEKEKEGRILFLITQLVKKEDGPVKILV